MEYGLAWMALLSMPLMLACGVIEHAAGRCAKGTRGRYVLRTLERALRGGVAIFLVATAAFCAVRAEWVTAVLALLLVAGFVAHWRKIDQDDDDDFWKDLGRKISGWLSVHSSAASMASS